MANAKHRSKYQALRPNSKIFKCCWPIYK